MIRTALLAGFAIVLVGCGPSEDKNAAGNRVDSATYVRPTEEKLGVTTMADFAKESGLKSYPGSENSAGEVFSHGDGVRKTVVIFTTSDSIDKIAEFYKGEGLDVATKSKPIGLTKSGSQVMIGITPDPNGKNVVKVTGLVNSKKGPSPQP